MNATGVQKLGYGGSSVGLSIIIKTDKPFHALAKLLDVKWHLCFKVPDLKSWLQVTEWKWYHSKAGYGFLFAFRSNYDYLVSFPRPDLAGGCFRIKNTILASKKMHYLV